ncbi:DNA-binding response regulator [Pseudomonas mucidolens]|uniref:response regulator transcription factor n=1 Tax=Pseudomonas mucidolens TaxID=46679 RepID=UPI0030D9132B
MQVNAVSPCTKPHVLIIDDSVSEVRPLLQLLQTQPWRLSFASDPHQGYQRALTLRPDLILLDVRMPKMSGFTLCRLLREAAATRSTPVIFLTSSSTLEERLEGFALGGVDYVLKPFEPHEVLARIRLHLQLTRRGEAAEALPAELATPADAEQIVLQAAMRYIGQNLEVLPSLADIALTVGTHEKRLSGIFRARLGTTVFGYIREARLLRGQALLLSGSMNMQDIAEEIGFKSAANFATAFRERFAMTPSQFRQQAQGTQEAGGRT